MGCDYCGPPAPAPEPDVTPLAAPSGTTSGSRDTCCDCDDAGPLDTTASGQNELAPEKPDDCSPGKYADNKTEDHTDAPDCCRGKVSPCCDTSCLDRLAIRECEMSATAAPGPNSQPNSEYPLFEKRIRRSLTPFSLRWSYRSQGLQPTSSICPRPLWCYSTSPRMYLPCSYCSWPGNLL
jgi:hypothetical protein